MWSNGRPSQQLLSSCYIIKLCSRLLVLYCRNCPKALYDFLFVIIELFSIALTVEALQGKTCQNSLLSGGVCQFEPIFQGKGSSLGFWKTRYILLSDSANCTVMYSRFDTIPACGRRTDRRQTDGIAVASTALAMRALRRAVKMANVSSSEHDRYSGFSATRSRPI